MIISSPPIFGLFMFLFELKIVATRLWEQFRSRSLYILYFIFKEMFKPGCPAPKELSDTSTLSSYLWKIENKYYTADVHLCACSVSSLPHQCEFASNMNFQSVIIVFDQKEVSFKPYLIT